MSPIQIDRDRLITRLVDLCKISSPSGQEDPVADYIKKSLKDLGYALTSDEAGNLYTRTESTTGENLFISSHMDTVPVSHDAPIQVIRKNGIIQTDGKTILGGDDKQGIAAALEMLTLCHENPGKHRGLDVIFTVKEELGSLGSALVDKEKIRAEHGFNLDGESLPGSVICKAPQKSRFTATVAGKSAHAALAPEEGINAIVIAGSIISQLPIGVPGPASTSNIGMISGGRQTNVVPDSAKFTGELRSFSPEEFISIQKSINSISEKTASNMGGSVSILWEEIYKSYHVLQDEACAQWFIEACHSKSISPQFIESRGGGDSNQLNNKGLRNLVFGLGMHNIHTNQEYLIEEEYISGVELLLQIVFP